jgi:hypothetical protein
MTGPLAPFADLYQAELHRRGYTARSMIGELRQVARFSRWLDADELRVADVSEARVEEFLSWQRAEGRHRSQWSRPGLRCLLDVLRGLGVLAAGEPAAGSPTDVLLARLSVICWPSGGWRPARSRCIWRVCVGSSRAWRRTVGSPSW